MPGRKFTLVAVLFTLAWAVPVLAQDASSSGQTGAQQYIVVGIDLFQRAQQEVDAGDYQTAVQDYTLFILLNPTFGQGYFFRGQAYAQLNDMDNALTDFNQALAYPSPDDQQTGQMYTFRALVYLQQGNTEAALADLNTAIEAAPDLAEPYYQRGRLYLADNQWEAALADYNKLAELAPDFAGTYAGRALANAQLGNTQAALSDYDKFIELQPDNALAYYQRSLVKAELVGL